MEPNLIALWKLICQILFCCGCIVAIIIDGVIVGSVFLEGVVLIDGCGGGFWWWCGGGGDGGFWWWLMEVEVVVVLDGGSD